MLPYVEPTAETTNEIDTKQEIIDTDFIDLQNEFNKVNDVATTKKKKNEDTIESVIIMMQIYLVLLMIFGGKTTCLTIEIQ